MHRTVFALAILAVALFGPLVVLAASRPTVTHPERAAVSPIAASLETTW